MRSKKLSDAALDAAFDAAEIPSSQLYERERHELLFNLAHTAAIHSIFSGIGDQRSFNAWENERTDKLGNDWIVCELYEHYDAAGLRDAIEVETSCKLTEFKAVWDMALKTADKMSAEPENQSRFARGIASILPLPRFSEFKPKTILLGYTSSQEWAADPECVAIPLPPDFVGKVKSAVAAISVDGASSVTFNDVANYLFYDENHFRFDPDYLIDRCDLLVFGGGAVQFRFVFDGSSDNGWTPPMSLSSIIEMPDFVVPSFTFSVGDTVLWGDDGQGLRDGEWVIREMDVEKGRCVLVYDPCSGEPYVEEANIADLRPGQSYAATPSAPSP